MTKNNDRNNILVARHPPVDFCAKVEVVAAYVEVKGKLLVLQRNGSEKGCWGVPAGKVESGEELSDAMRRELHEETAIELLAIEDLRYLGVLYIRKPEIDYVYHMYHLSMDEQPPVCISNEHQSYGWYNREDLHQLPLMLGARESLDFFASCIIPPSGSNFEV